MTDHQFSLIIKSNQVRYEKDKRILAKKLGVSERTYQRYLSDLSNVKVNDLKIIIDELHISDEEILKFIKQR